MSSPITLSGFNNIDFTQILNAVMQQEQAPVLQLQSRQESLTAQKSAFATFASKLAAVQSAAQALASADSVNGTALTVSDATRVAATAGASATPGTYEITITELARAQVTTSVAVADADQTVVSHGGAVTIGGVRVALAGDVTLQGLADAINATPDVTARATVVQNTGGFQLVLTGTATGAAAAFSVTDELVPEGGFGFSAANAQEATDASALVNNVAVTSPTNRFETAIAGVGFTALKKDPGSAVIITITASTESVKSLVQKLVTAFNDMTAFVGEQTAAAGRGESDNIGRDPLVRGLRRSLASVLTGSYGTGSVAALAEIGFQFERSGELTFDAARFDTAMAGGKADISRLFGGTDGKGGVFGTLDTTIQQYTDAGGLLPHTQSRLDDEMRKVSDRIDAMNERLATRRAALQKEFIAADQAIAALNAQKSQLGSLSGGYSLF